MLRKELTTAELLTVAFALFVVLPLLTLAHRLHLLSDGQCQSLATRFDVEVPRRCGE